MSNSVVLLCDDVAAGCLLSQACRARGLEPPLWCSIRQGVRWEPDETIKVGVVFAASLPGEAGRVQASGWDWPNISLIFVGETVQVDGTVFHIISPSDGWQERVIDVMLDLLGATTALLPSYENRLRVLGRVLDRRGYASVSIIEDADGLRIEPETDGKERLATFDFRTQDFGRLARESLNSRGEPEWERPRGRLTSAGHEALLRYLGRDLDQRGAERIRVVWLAHSLVVSGYESQSPYGEPQSFQDIYRATDLQVLRQRASAERHSGAGWIKRLRRTLGIG